MMYKSYLFLEKISSKIPHSKEKFLKIFEDRHIKWKKDSECAKLMLLCSVKDASLGAQVGEPKKFT